MFANVHGLHFSLGILVFLTVAGKVGSLGFIQSHQSGIRTFRAVHGRSAHAHHQPQHSRAGIHIRQEYIGAVRIANPGCTWHVSRSVIRSGDSLNQQGHLFVSLIQSSPFTVIQGRKAHGAGIDGADRIFEFLQSFFQGSSVGTEYGLIFPGKGISKPIFQNAGRPDNIRILAIVFQDVLEAILHLLRKCSSPEAVCKLFRQ